MPFWKALMPEATSPIMPEILPRPNSRITTTATTRMPQIPGACILFSLVTQYALHAKCRSEIGLIAHKHKNVFLVEGDEDILSHADCSIGRLADADWGVETFHFDLADVDADGVALADYTARCAGATLVDMGAAGWADGHCNGSSFSNSGSRDRAKRG